MDGISRSRGWDKEIPHCVLPMEQLVLSDKWARMMYNAMHHSQMRHYIMINPYDVTSGSDV